VVGRAIWPRSFREVHFALHACDKRVLGEPKRWLKEILFDLDWVLSGPLSDENIHEHDEIKWIQRSRANWMKGGERNTSCFHSFATTRKKRNSVKKLKYENGNWIE
jgi:hypothetical protein